MPAWSWDTYRLRQLMNAGSDIADLAMTPGHHAAEQIDTQMRSWRSWQRSRPSAIRSTINQSLADYLQLLQDMSEGKNPAISTGIGGLDRILNGGLRKGVRVGRTPEARQNGFVAHDGAQHCPHP